MTLKVTLQVKEPYILNESKDREVVYSIHVPYEIMSEGELDK